LSYFPHVFETAIVRHDVGRYAYTVVFLDPALSPGLPFKQHPKLRFEGEINDQPFAGAWQPVKGRHYAMLSKALLKDTGLGLGDRVEIRFRIGDQEAVDVPDEILQAIAADAQVADIWSKMTAGTKRAFSHWVGDAKSKAVRDKRLLGMVDGLKADAKISPVELVRNLRKLPKQR
jgi:hypothetical protein